MNATQAENLRILIRHMETNVTRTLYMGVYGTCGSPACAIGEAAAMQCFQQQGLSFHGKDIAYNGMCRGHGVPAAAIFGLGDEFNRLFGEAGYNPWGRNDVTPQEWAAEARKVLAENGYSMDEKPAQTFQDFMAKVREPVSLDEPEKYGGDGFLDWLAGHPSR